MRAVQVIKSYSVLTQSIQSGADLKYEDDKAVAEYRAFDAVAHLHANRVTNPLALDAMLSIVESIKTDLLNRRKLIS